MGSLQKPFVAQAWAAAHGEAATPRFTCDGRRCWRRSGHGTLGLTRAVTVSCNEYFLGLAADTPPALLRATLIAAGFGVDTDTVTPEEAIGLSHAVTITPRRLLAAYVDLTRTPWLRGESVRGAVLAGLRQAALDGTARGLGRRGLWAKTGTVDSRGRAAQGPTIGWALAVDDAGGAVLGRLDPGTGRAAAHALAAWLGPPGGGPAPAAVSDTPPRTPGTGDRVRVRLFALAGGRRVLASNRGTAPAAGGRGFVGPGAAVTLRAGDQLAESLWELEVPALRLVRRVKAALSVSADESGRLEVVADMAAREWVSGVVAAELPGGDRERRLALAAAVLRFAARGPRHARADFCDATHCAWFIGRGPRLSWPEPRRPIADTAPVRLLDDAEWEAARAQARGPGPSYWTSHCGGRPLSAHAVWGGEDRSVVACPRHGPSSSRPWTRTWTDAALFRAFGGPVSSLAVTWTDGVFGLEIGTAQGSLHLLYDDAHERLARVLGWGAMPSPPDRVVRKGGGYRAEGVGLGHRVGLCLGD